MRIITDTDVRACGVTPKESVEWAREVFLMKDRCQLPPKISLHPRDNDFFNTMPSILPEEYHTFGCKVVSRICGQHPALKSEAMIFDTQTGAMEALVNTDWITARRTGAVAALAIATLQRSDASVYSFVGLGEIGHSVLTCLLETVGDGQEITVRLKRYKDQAERTLEEFAAKYPKCRFEICDTMEGLVEGADVVVSCITVADGLMVENTELFKPGVLVVPVHTRGFQNCDRIFDRVVADDRGHVCGFRYFNEFREFAELGDVLNGKAAGRKNDGERILAYNIGISLLDVYYAYRIINRLIDNH